MQQAPNIIGYNSKKYASPEIEKLSPKNCNRKNDNDDVDMDTHGHHHHHHQSHPQEEEPRRRNPTIRFNVRVAVKETIHRHDYTSEELARTWYKKSDFVTMKHAFTVVVQLFASGRYPGDDDDEMTIRGLEYRHRQGATRRKTNKLNALYAVLDEQERQWQNGYDNDEDIRAVYLVNSTHCSQAAHAMGKQDEVECMRINSDILLTATSCHREDDAMSISSDHSGGDYEHGIGHGVSTPLKRKTSGFSRFFHKHHNLHGSTNSTTSTAG